MEEEGRGFPTLLFKTPTTCFGKVIVLHRSRITVCTASALLMVIKS